MADGMRATVLFMFIVCISSHPGKTEVVQLDDIKEVHVVFMNHLDVGYDGISPEVGYINAVLNTYFTKHFPRAINVTKQLKSAGYVETFIYTTHPWLVWMYVNCPDNFTLSEVKLQCPSTVEKAAFVNALQEGTISYHAGPMNMQPENMNAMLFELSLNVSQNLDEMLGIQRKFRTLSQRDVPGMTKAVIPTLLKKNIAALSVGVNDGTSPPAVPKIFTWKFDEENEILAMWHPGGYPDNPGPNPSSPGGISVKDCVTVANFDKALCFAFRTDNSGPPINVEEILGYYEILRAEFKGAKIFASTFERFVEAVQPIRNQLPILTNEIGDTWISGIASDPRKMAEYRGVTQTLTECIENGDCDPNDKRIRESVIYLMKPGEHTWGLPSLLDSYNWSNQNFNTARLGQNYKNCEQAWLEQREFTYIAVKKLGDHPVVQKIKDRLDMLTPERPDLREFVEVPIGTYEALDGMQISFAEDGSINRLYDPTNKRNWTVGENFGKFVYQTYDEGMFNKTNKLYSYKWAIYTKPNLTLHGNAVTKLWETQVDKMYRWEGNDLVLWLKIVMVDPTSYIMYGAPREIWIRYVYNMASSSPAYFDVDLRWFDKTPTRIPETLMYYFSPLVPTRHVPAYREPTDGDNTLRYVKLTNEETDYSWKLRKLGKLVDPSSVVLNGSQYLHAIDSDVRLTNSQDHGIRFVSLDVPLLSLSTESTAASPFPVPLVPISQREITGAGFNIYNNMWDTNYIFYYPYKQGNGDENFRANFKIIFD